MRGEQAHRHRAPERPLTVQRAVDIEDDRSQARRLDHVPGIRTTSMT
jgi:hypothetical protein